jgi:sugar phosphate isomerase/epimerase
LALPIVSNLHRRNGGWSPPFRVWSAESSCMNQLGILSHLFRGSPAEVAGICRRHGLTCVQLTPNFPGLRFHEPAQFTPQRCRKVAESFPTVGVAVACLSGSAPLMDPDLKRRHRGLVRLHALIRHCRDFGTDKVVLETGSLSPHSPWAPFPPNRSGEAWSELCCMLAQALRVAAGHGVTLLLKPEPSHVLATAEDSLRLLAELDDPNLGVVLDVANFLFDSLLEGLAGRLVQLFERLSPWTGVVHLKDLNFSPAGVSLPRAGRGALDFQLFSRLLRRHLPRAPVILEHLCPVDLPAVIAGVEPWLRNP